MAEYSGNDVYLSINGKNVGGLWRGFEMTFNSGTEDTSAGAGIDWEKAAAKLQHITAVGTIVYDDVTAAADFTALWEDDMIVRVIYGPEGDVSGKPKHEQDFKIESIPGPATGHDKPLVTLEFRMRSTGVPQSNIYAGDTF
jgi:hypothetical protein